MKAKAIGVPLLVLVGVGLGNMIAIPSLPLGVGVVATLLIAVGILVSGKE